MPHQSIQFNDHITAAPPLSHTKHTPGLFEEGRLWKSAQVFAAHQAGRSEAMEGWNGAVWVSIFFRGLHWEVKELWIEIPRS